MNPHIIEYYYDEKLSKRVPVNELGNAVVDWGETIPGTTKEKALWVKSLIADRIIFRQPNTEDIDLRISNFPTKLLGQESAKVMLEFAPNENRIKPLTAGWSFDLVIG